MPTISRQLGEWFRWAGQRLQRAEGWQLFLMAIIALLILPLVPALLVLALIVAFVMLVRAWVREFVYLMKLRDDAFPGHNDKLIWAILLIVLPPVGVWMFHTYREAHWPEAKPGRADGFDMF